MKWRKGADVDSFGREGSLWTSDCGRARIVDGCSDAEPFEVQLRVHGHYKAKGPWRKSLASAKRAAATLLEQGAP